ncbi:hypothetical protein JW848_07045 [Candidatus Bipolaricaulota bacterium]|nr:hypothetical protein [Candidatus Bipolaricaulota bacterium]
MVSSDALEALLRPPAMDMPPYPPKVITLASGEKMVVRQIARDEVPILLEAISPLLWVERDYYDIVSARLSGELLAYKRYRVRDEYCLAGLIDGELAGIVNGRLVNAKVGMSYHTLTLRRGLRVGSHLFAAKMEYHIDILGQEEVLIVAESPIGFRRWMIEYPLDKKHEVQHELGGVPSWVLTVETYRKAKPRLCSGTRPVPAELMETARVIRAPKQGNAAGRVLMQEEQAGQSPQGGAA